MKPKTKALLLVPVLVISLALALLMIPNPGVPRNTKFVFAAGAAGAAQWPDTYISTVRLRSTTEQIVIFYATGEIVYTEVGDNIAEVHAAVNIATTYASSGAEAMANTKVHVTISHPIEGTIYTGFLDVVSYSEWPGLYNVSFGDTFATHTLVAGTYTITTTYQVYA